MSDQFSRSELIFGEKAMAKLFSAKVAIFGVGGVGGYVAESLARAGVGKLHLIDHDKIDITNINRQIYATHRTIDKYKVDVAKKRTIEINPNIDIKIHRIFFDADVLSEFNFSEYDYVVDAIDSVPSKVCLIENAIVSVPVISAMGAGNRVDPTALTIADIYSTSICPLARIMRKELKARGVRSLKVVYSKEPPIKVKTSELCEFGMGAIIGSSSFVPPAAGLLIASEVVKDLIGCSSTTTA